MPNLPAAEKSIKKDKKRRLANLAITSEVKTLIKKLNGLISAKKHEEAKNLLSLVMSRLDKAAKKGVIDKGNADRRKSRLSSKLAKIK